ncbi:MAG: M20/M25/M40 family metallo-hydrolase [Patescibacteria group bacterium]
MQDKIIPLAKKLISVPSVTGDIEKAVAILKFTERYMEGHTVTPFVSNSFPSLLYSNKDKDTRNFKFILNAHLDVVPGTTSQFTPQVKNGKLYGRGAYDTKAGAATMMLLFKELAPKIPFPLALQITTDEEVGGEDGTKYQIENGVRGDFVIATECGSNFRIIHEAKARLVVKLIATGKTSHSAYPWLGDNAIWKLQQAIHNILQKYPIPDEALYQTTVNVTHIETQGKEKRDTAYNRTPDYCEAIIDVRYIPTEKETIVAQIKSLLIDGVSMEILHNSAPHQTDEHNQHVQALHKIVTKVYKEKLPLVKQHATSDARHYSGIGVDGIEFGPIGANQHTDGEYVNIKSLDTYYAILKKFLLSVDK